jgi:hypothetical protein
VDPPAGVIRRIEEKREAAEERLRRTLEPLEKTRDYQKCIPAFVEFAGDLFDAVAKELWQNHAADQEHLEKLLAYVVQGIMAAQSLARARPPSEAAGGQGHIWQYATGEQWQEGAGGAKRPVKDPAYGQHGDWERFAPRAVRSLLRLSPYRENVRFALDSALREKMTYWMFRSPAPVAAEQPAESMPAGEEAPSEPLIEAPPPKPRAKRGPSTDYETAKRVAKIIARAGAGWSLSKKLDRVLQALDKARIPIPKTWKKKELLTWTDAGLNNKTRKLARSAIQHHRELAAEGRRL